jgi:general stress protein YciG
MGEVIGNAEHYAQFVKLCRLRIEQLGVTYDTLDAICGFPARYTAKLLCGSSTMSVYSFFTLARALALMPEFRHDDEQLAHLRKNGNWIKMRRAGERFRGKGGGAYRFQNHRDFYQQIGRKGGLRKSALTKFYRERARKGAVARWGKNRAQETANGAS